MKRQRKHGSYRSNDLSKGPPYPTLGSNPSPDDLTWRLSYIVTLRGPECAPSAPDAFVIATGIQDKVRPSNLKGPFRRTGSEMRHFPTQPHTLSDTPIIGLTTGRSRQKGNFRQDTCTIQSRARVSFATSAPSMRYCNCLRNTGNLLSVESGASRQNVIWH